MSRWRRCLSLIAVTGALVASAPTVNAMVTTPERPAELWAPRAGSAYALTPLLTGGILETRRSVQLNQEIDARDVDAGDCTPYAIGSVAVQETMNVEGLVDLGYDDVPSPDPRPVYQVLPRTDYTMGGSYSIQGESYACRGDQLILAQGGICSGSVVPAGPGAIYEPTADSFWGGSEYVPGSSARVVGAASSTNGLDCIAQRGEVPWAPGSASAEYEPRARLESAFVRPSKPLEQDEKETRVDLTQRDTSCAYGDPAEGGHTTGIYVWTGVYPGEDSSDWRQSRCSSVVSGYQRTVMKRALVVKEVRVFQMTPSGDFAEVPSTEKVVDGNQVRLEILIENRWKRDIRSEVKLWDTEYKREMETESGEKKPIVETFPAGMQKKVTVKLRTDGVAWETAGKPIAWRKIGVLTPYGGARFTMQVAPRPALLLHGWNSNPAAWDAWRPFVSSVRDGWKVETVKGMDTDPVSGYSIQVNAGTLKSSIAQIRKETGAVHVDLIGHSMGGLISRWYISRMMGAPAQDGRPVVRSLTMFGTPNLGSDCAYEVIGVGHAAMLGALVFDSALAKSVGDYIPTYQLTPFYQVTQMLPQTPAKSGVYYSHRAGTPLPVFPCGLKEPFGQSGPNDGPVVLPSVLGRGVGGPQLAPPDNTIHTDMTDERSYFDSALSKVLGLGPAEAVRLVRATRTTTTRAPDVKAVTVPGTYIDGASAPVGSGGPVTVTTTGGVSRVSVLAPVGSEVTVTDPSGKVLTSAPGSNWPITVQAQMPAGDISVRVDPRGTTGTVGVALSLPTSPLVVSATAIRKRSRITITATIEGARGKSAAVQAVIAPGTPGARILTLKKSGAKYVGSATVPAGATTGIAVGARVGIERRVTFIAVD